MKKTTYSVLSILSLVFLSFFTSCTPEACDLVNCAYGGVCDEGNCICPVGYEGIHCETIARDKFIDNGIYSVNEDGSLSEKGQYTATIEPGDKVNEVRIKNFLNIFKNDDVIASVSHDTIWIAPQTINGYTVEGTGYITGKNPIGRHYYQDAIITFYYTKTDVSGGPNDGAVDHFGSNGTPPSDWNKN